MAKFISVIILLFFCGAPLAAVAMGGFFKAWPPTAVASIILIVLFINGFLTIPTVKAAIVTRFQKRTGKKFKEGLNWIWPIIEDVQLFSLELATTKIKVEIFTADQQEVTLEGSFQWKPDFNKLMVFIEMSEDTIKEGITDAIRSELTSVGSVSELNDIIKRKAFLELLIDCSLRLTRPPHHHVNLKGSSLEMGDTLKEWFEDGCKGVELDEKKKAKFWNKINPGEWKLPAQDIKGALKLDLVRFYEENVSRIKTVQELSELFPGEESPVEKRHGIIVVKYQLTNYNFSPETEKSIQKQRQSTGVVEGAEVLKNFVEKTIEDLVLAGVSPEDAVTNAELLLGVPGIQKTRISGGALPLVTISPEQKGGGKDAPQRNSEKKDSV